MSDTPSQPDDELKGSEQPFVAHLIELRDRLVRAVIAVAVAAAVLAICIKEIIDSCILAPPLVLTFSVNSFFISLNDLTG